MKLMKVDTSFEITEEDVLNAIDACRSTYNIEEIDKYVALDAILSNAFGLGDNSASAIVERLLDDDCKRTLLETFADRFCDQIYIEIMNRFGLGE